MALTNFILFAENLFFCLSERNDIKPLQCVSTTIKILTQYNIFDSILEQIKMSL